MSDPYNRIICSSLSNAVLQYKKATERESEYDYYGALVHLGMASSSLQALEASDLIKNCNVDITKVTGLSKLPAIKDDILRKMSSLYDKVQKCGVNGSSASESCDAFPPLMKEDFRDRFDDIVGLQDAKEQLYIQFIRPLLYPNLYPNQSKGILLYGAPGTGKTKLMKAACNELEMISNGCISVKLFAPNPADLKGKYVGETEQKIKALFNCAGVAAKTATTQTNKKTFSIIFLDEVDSVASSRKKDPTGTVASSVNALLQAMDGINTVENVVVIAATNFPWTLDTAILRRFDSTINVTLPHEADILKLIKLEIGNYIYRGTENKTITEDTYKSFVHFFPLINNEEDIYADTYLKQLKSYFKTPTNIVSKRTVEVVSKTDIHPYGVPSMGYALNPPFGLTYNHRTLKDITFFADEFLIDEIFEDREYYESGAVASLLFYINDINERIYKKEKYTADSLIKEINERRSLFLGQYESFFAYLASKLAAKKASGADVARYMRAVFRRMGESSLNHKNFYAVQTYDSYLQEINISTKNLSMFCHDYRRLFSIGKHTVEKIILEENTTYRIISDSYMPNLKDFTDVFATDNRQKMLLKCNVTLVDERKLDDYRNIKKVIITPTTDDGDKIMTFINIDEEKYSMNKENENITETIYTDEGTVLNQLRVVGECTFTFYAQIKYTKINDIKESTPIEKLLLIVKDKAFEFVMEEGQVIKLEDVFEYIKGYKIVKDDVPVTYIGKDGKPKTKNVRVSAIFDGIGIDLPNKLPVERIFADTAKSIDSTNSAEQIRICNSTIGNNKKFKTFNFDHNFFLDELKKLSINLTDQEVKDLQAYSENPEKMLTKYQA